VANGGLSEVLSESKQSKGTVGTFIFTGLWVT
jgi:hypothetical protein